METTVCFCYQLVFHRAVTDFGSGFGQIPETFLNPAPAKIWPDFWIWPDLRKRDVCYLTKRLD